MAIFPLMRKDMAENDAASQAVFERQTKSYASENDLFPFSVFWIVAKKTSNTGAERLLGRDHLITDGVYPLCKPIEANSMKIYGAAKTHRNSTNNTKAVYQQKSGHHFISASSHSLTLAMICSMFCGEKNSGMDTVPAMVPKKRLVCSWFPRRAEKSCCISGAGGSRLESWQVNS